MPLEQGEDPWPEFPASSGDVEAPEAPSQAMTAGGEPQFAKSADGGHRLFRIAVLLGLLGVVTVLGIVVGRAIEPGSSKTATTAASIPTTTRRTTRPHVPDKWGPLPVKALGSITSPAGRAGAAIVAGTLLVVGGDGSNRVIVGPVGGEVATLPGPRAAAQVFTVAGTVYVVGGEQGSKPTDEILRIDLAKGTTVAAGKFVEPLAEAGVVTSGGAAYFAGGWTGEKYATGILRFTPPSTSDLVARLPDGVRSAAVALVGDTLYVAGGRTAGGLSRNVYKVAIASGKVTALGKLPQALAEAVLVASGGKLYVLGGLAAGGKELDTVVQIDEATGHAAAAGRMPEPLAGAAAVPDGERTLVVSPAGMVYRLG